MKCKKCGSEIPDNSRFCLVCGTTIIEAKPQEPENEPAPYGVCKVCGKPKLSPMSSYCSGCYTVFEPDRRLYDDTPKGQAEYEQELGKREYFANEMKELHEKAEQRNKEMKSTDNAMKAVWGAVGVIFLGVLLFIVFLNRPGNKPSPYPTVTPYFAPADTYISSAPSANRRVASSSMTEDMKAALWALAQQVVKNDLKAPSTAKFPFSYGSPGVSFGTSGNLYYVSAYVDAENGFGASLRQNFTVYATFTGSSMKLDHVDYD